MRAKAIEVARSRDGSQRIEIGKISVMQVKA